MPSQKHMKQIMLLFQLLSRADADLRLQQRAPENQNSRRGSKLEMLTFKSSALELAWQNWM